MRLLALSFLCLPLCSASTTELVDICSWGQEVMQWVENSISWWYIVLKLLSHCRGTVALRVITAWWDSWSFVWFVNAILGWFGSFKPPPEKDSVDCMSPMPLSSRVLWTASWPVTYWVTLNARGCQHHVRVQCNIVQLEWHHHDHVQMSEYL